MFLPLVSALIIAPIVLFYFVAIKSVDRYEPEPWWLLILCFSWGVFGATFLALRGNTAAASGLASLMGVPTENTLVMASTASFIAPLIEESAKGGFLLVVWGLSVFWLKELDGALDGAIYGGIIGLGFTLTEDAVFMSRAAAESGAGALVGTYVVRTVMAGLGHASFTAMTGLGIGLAVESQATWVKLLAPLGGWASAMGLHGLHNLLVTFLLGKHGEGFFLKLVAFWTFDLLFFVLLLVLVLRDRAIVVRGLVDEVGRLLHPLEFKRTISYRVLVPLWNAHSLLRSPGGYRRSRQKQLDLVKLAFLKRRKLRGEVGLENWERDLRARVQFANAQGVFIGPRQGL